MKPLQSITALLALIGSLFVGWFFLDARFARSVDVKLVSDHAKSVERRLDYKIENDKLMGMQQRQWQIQEKFPDIGRAPMMIQKDARELDTDLEMQKDKVKRMENK